jgi:hypothetical protein
MRVEYIETNSSWCKNTRQDIDFLKELRRNGVATLLVSISPFHNEHVPLQRINECLSAAQAAGVSVFPWIQEFYGEMASLNAERTHLLTEYTARYGPGYTASLPHRYGLTMRGRALDSFAPDMEHRLFEEILSDNGPCRELFDVSHFHVDLEGSYVPGLCAGFSVPLPSLSEAFSPDRFPLLSLLSEKGIGSLYALAHEKFGFTPRTEYVSKCDLCEHIRQYLAHRHAATFREIGPREYYTIE